MALAWRQCAVYDSDEGNSTDDSNWSECSSCSSAVIARSELRRQIEEQTQAAQKFFAKKVADSLADSPSARRAHSEERRESTLSEFYPDTEGESQPRTDECGTEGEFIPADGTLSQASARRPSVPRPPQVKDELEGMDADALHNHLKKKMLNRNRGRGSDKPLPEDYPATRLDHNARCEVTKALRKGIRNADAIELDRFVTAHMIHKREKLSPVPQEESLDEKLKQLPGGTGDAATFSAAVWAILFIAKLKCKYSKRTRFQTKVAKVHHIETQRQKKYGAISKKFYGASIRSMGLHIKKQRQGLSDLLFTAVRDSNMRTDIAKHGRVVGKMQLLHHEEDKLFDRGEDGGASATGTAQPADAMAASTSLVPATNEEELFSQQLMPQSSIQEYGTFRGRPLGGRRRSSVKDLNHPQNRELTSSRKRSMGGTGSRSGSRNELSKYLFDADGLRLETHRPLIDRDVHSDGDSDSVASETIVQVGRQSRTQEASQPIASVEGQLQRKNLNPVPKTANLFIWHHCWNDETYKEPFAGTSTSVYQYASQTEESNLKAFTRTYVPNMDKELSSLSQGLSGEDGPQKVETEEERKAAAAARAKQAKEEHGDVLDRPFYTYEPFLLNKEMEHSRFINKSIVEVRRLIRSNDYIFVMKRDQILKANAHVSYDPNQDLCRAEQRVKLGVKKHQVAEVEAYASEWFTNLVAAIEFAMQCALTPKMQQVAAIFKKLFDHHRLSKQDFVDALDAVDEDQLTDLGVQFLIMRLRVPFELSIPQVQRFVERRGIKVLLMDEPQMDKARRLETSEGMRATEENARVRNRLRDPPQKNDYEAQRMRAHREKERYAKMLRIESMQRTTATYEARFKEIDTTTALSARATTRTGTQGNINKPTFTRLQSRLNPTPLTARSTAAAAASNVGSASASSVQHLPQIPNKAKASSNISERTPRSGTIRFPQLNVTSANRTPKESSSGATHSVCSTSTSPSVTTPRQSYGGRPE